MKRTPLVILFKIKYKTKVLYSGRESMNFRVKLRRNRHVIKLDVRCKRSKDSKWPSRR